MCAVAESGASRELPLTGVRVLDLSRFIAGPMCTMLLADMGADVVKVERPGGEDVRRVAPLWNGESVYAMTYGRNKRAIGLDTRSSEGRVILHDLARWADVIVENYRPGTLEMMGLGYPQLKEQRPEIIVTSVSGYGQGGPLRDRALFDCIAQAASGLMYRNGEGEETPQLAGIFVGDHLAGLYAAVGTLLAILEQRRSGLGQHVDVALFDSLFSCLGPVVPAYLMSGAVMPRTGNRDLFAAPANVFRCGDGFVYIHAGTDALFGRFCDVIGRPELLEDQRFQSAEARVKYVEEAEAIVAAWTAERSAAECERIVADAGIPAAAVADIPDAVKNPQIMARDMVVKIATAEGDIWVPGNPVKLSATPSARFEKPPSVNEHVEEILRSVLKYDKSRIERLAAQGVVEI